MDDNVLVIDGKEVVLGGMTYHDDTRNINISFNACESDGVDIVDSYEVKDDIVKKEFLEALQSAGFNFGKRSIDSMIIEWKAHNILYNKGWFKKRTKDTGLNPKESWVRRLFYRFVCFIFTER